MKQAILILSVLSLCSNCFGAAIAQWKMNDDAATTTVVESIGSATGTFTHAAGDPDPNDNTEAHAATGQINGGLELEIYDYITVSDAAIFTPDGTAFSITAWVSLSANEGAADFMIINKMGTYVEWHFHISNDQLGFSMYDESAGQTTIGRLDTADYALYQGSGFIFVAGTYDGGSDSSGIKLYLADAQVDDSNNNSGTFNNVDNSNEDVWIGKYLESTAEGIIDNIVIYDEELTLTQIQALYNNGVGTEDVGLSLGKTRRSRLEDGYRSKYRSRYN